MQNNTQINYTIFEKKHHYMSIMKEVEILKRQMEYEALQGSGNTTKDRLAEIYQIRNIILAELIKEGLMYQYIQNADSPRQDIIRVTIDGVNYESNAAALKDIFRNSFEKYVPEGARRLPQVSAAPADNVPEPEIFADINVNKKKRVKAASAVSISAQPATIINTGSDKTEADETEDFYNELADVPQDAETAKAVNEPRKPMDSFLYDYHKVAAVMEGGNRGENFEFIIAPLYPYVNNPKPDIAVWCRGNNESVCRVTKSGSGTVTVDISGHSFLVRGSFKNGIFSSHIHAAGMTLNGGYNLKIETDKHRCSAKAALNMGHVYYTDSGNAFHVFPLEQDNLKNGNALCMIVTEGKNGREAEIYPSQDRADKLYCGGEYRMYNYWDDNILVSELMDREGKTPENVKKQKKKALLSGMSDAGSGLVNMLSKIIPAVIIALALFLGVAYLKKDSTQSKIKDAVEKLQPGQTEENQESMFEDTLSVTDILSPVQAGTEQTEGTEIVENTEGEQE